MIRYSTSVLKVRCPGDNALDAARVCGHDANARHFDALGGKLRVNLGEPLIGDRSAACAHVSQNDVAIGAERQVDEPIEAAPCVDVNLLSRLVPKV